ncbi:MAG: MotA/TolQ/ExbB proton channel family protein [Thermoguttaceae bacterium]|nr:MotA/TolQ/ExbB proton channel family protein [Thermoguttaceae bacterium]
MKRLLTPLIVALLLAIPVYAQVDNAASDPDAVTDEAPLVPSLGEESAPPALPDDDVPPPLPAADENAPAPESGAAAAPETSETEQNAPPVLTPEQMAQEALAEGDKEVAQQEEAERLAKEKEQAEMEAKKNEASRIDILELIKSGGYLMWALGALSVLGLMFILERFIALRYNAIMPRRLFKQIAPYLEPSRFSPMAIWAICKKYRSPAARVIQAALLKIGRPLPEVISAVEAAKQDEAANLYRNVGWLTLVSSLAPLLGLLGTVWGMILAFHRVASLEIGANRAEQLSSGIYVALVTTAAGLAIAIPVALFAHFFESRILKAFHKLDSKLLPLYDVMEKQEGKPRISLSQYQSK